MYGKTMAVPSHCRRFEDVDCADSGQHWQLLVEDTDNGAKLKVVDVEG
jgi:hypothetical protein